MDEVFGLEVEEVIQRNRTTAELMRYLIWKDKFLSQKAKTNWLNEGDVNSGFYHRWIKKNSKKNGLEGIFLNNRWIDSVAEVKGAAASYFQKQFQARNISRPQFSSGSISEEVISDTQ